MLFLSATLNHKIKIFYDCEDHEIINRKHLAECDLYFKRSFDNERHPNISAKIFPLGLNYAVTSEDDFAATRLFWNGLNKSVFFDIYNAVRKKGFQRNTTKVHNFEGYANFETNPKILFSARLWKPEKVANETLKQERLYINEVRVECIRKLKARFKEDFVGGLFPDDLTLKNFPDCADTKTNTSKAKYLRTVKESNICIATMGLRKSTGWKMAEYVAGAKAIVSEKLYYQPTGDFENGKNYLEFSSPDECVERVTELFYNPEKRYEMKKANYRYYHEYLRPDVLIWNTLQTAIIKNGLSQNYGIE